MSALKVTKGKDGRHVEVITAEDIPEYLYNILKTSNLISCEQLMISSVYEVASKTNLSTRDIQLIKHAATSKLAPVISPVANITHSGDSLSFGSPNLDAIFKTLLQPGTILEIWGESGSGKTQLALQICAALKPEFCSAYVTTEGAFPITRFKQLCKCRGSILMPCEVQQCNSLEAMNECIFKHLPLLVKLKPIKVVVIDSIAAQFRCGEVDGGGVRRAQIIRSVGQQLKYLAVEHNLSVVVVNQATSVPDSGLQPALGLTWSYIINTRIHIQKVDGNSTLRNVTLDKSSSIKKGTTVTCWLKNVGLI